MSQLLKPVLLACVCLFALAEQALADSLAEANRAYKANDFEKAAKLLRPLADQGNAEAQTKLGILHEQGQGVPQDYKESVKWYYLAAKQEAVIAQNNLGLMYSKGHGVPQDYAEAVKWYQKAAQKKYMPAQNNLGMMYYLGEGVPQDYAEAVKLNRFAAEQGYSAAQEVLGVAYFEGKGVPQDYVLSHMWLNIATANSEKGELQQKFIELRDSLAKVMTTQQIAEAQKLARKCTANKFKGC